MLPSKVRKCDEKENVHDSNRSFPTINDSVLSELKEKISTRDDFVVDGGEEGIYTHKPPAQMDPAYKGGLHRKVSNVPGEVPGASKHEKLEQHLRLRGIDGITPSEQPPHVDDNVHFSHSKTLPKEGSVEVIADNVIQGHAFENRPVNVGAAHDAPLSQGDVANNLLRQGSSEDQSDLMVKSRGNRPSFERKGSNHARGWDSTHKETQSIPDLSQNTDSANKPHSDKPASVEAAPAFSKSVFAGTGSGEPVTQSHTVNTIAKAPVDDSSLSVGDSPIVELPGLVREMQSQALRTDAHPAVKEAAKAGKELRKNMTSGAAISCVIKDKELSKHNLNQEWKGMQDIALGRVPPHHVAPFTAKDLSNAKKALKKCKMLDHSGYIPMEYPPVSYVAKTPKTSKSTKVAAGSTKMNRETDTQNASMKHSKLPFSVKDLCAAKKALKKCKMNDHSGYIPMENPPAKYLTKCPASMNNAKNAKKDVAAVPKAATKAAPIQDGKNTLMQRGKLPFTVKELCAAKKALRISKLSDKSGYIPMEHPPTVYLTSCPEHLSRDKKDIFEQATKQEGAPKQNAPKQNAPKQDARMQDATKFDNNATPMKHAKLPFSTKDQCTAKKALKKCKMNDKSGYIPMENPPAAYLAKCPTQKDAKQSATATPVASQSTPAAKKTASVGNKDPPAATSLKPAKLPFSVKDLCAAKKALKKSKTNDHSGYIPLENPPKAYLTKCPQDNTSPSVSKSAAKDIAKNVAKEVFGPMTKPMSNAKKNATTITPKQSKAPLTTHKTIKLPFTAKEQCIARKALSKCKMNDRSGYIPMENPPSTYVTHKAKKVVPVQEMQKNENQQVTEPTALPTGLIRKKLPFCEEELLLALRKLKVTKDHPNLQSIDQTWIDEKLDIYEPVPSQKAEMYEQPHKHSNPQQSTKKAQENISKTFVVPSTAKVAPVEAKVAQNRKLPFSAKDLCDAKKALKHSKIERDHTGFIPMEATATPSGFFASLRSMIFGKPQPQKHQNGSMKRAKLPFSAKELCKAKKALKQCKISRDYSGYIQMEDPPASYLAKCPKEKKSKKSVAAPAVQKAATKAAPVAAPAVQKAATKAAAPVAAPVAQKAAAPVAAPVAQKAAAPVAAPVAQKAAAPVAAPVAQKAAAPVAAPAVQKAAAPVAAPVAQKAAAPVAAPVAQKAAAPVAAPAVQKAATKAAPAPAVQKAATKATPRSESIPPKSAPIVMKHNKLPFSVKDLSAGKKALKKCKMNDKSGYIPMENPPATYLSKKPTVQSNNTSKKATVQSNNTSKKPAVQSSDDVRLNVPYFSPSRNVPHNNMTFPVPVATAHNSSNMQPRIQTGGHHVKLPFTLAELCAAKKALKPCKIVRDKSGFIPMEDSNYETMDWDEFELNEQRPFTAQDLITAKNALKKCKIMHDMSGFLPEDDTWTSKYSNTKHSKHLKNMHQNRDMFPNKFLSNVTSTFNTVNNTVMDSPHIERKVLPFTPADLGAVKKRLHHTNTRDMSGYIPMKSTTLQQPFTLEQLRFQKASLKMFDIAQGNYSRSSKGRDYIGNGKFGYQFPPCRGLAFNVQGKVNSKCNSGCCCTVRKLRAGLISREEVTRNYMKKHASAPNTGGVFSRFIAALAGPFSAGLPQTSMNAKHFYTSMATRHIPFPCAITRVHTKQPETLPATHCPVPQATLQNFVFDCRSDKAFSYLLILAKSHLQTILNPEYNGVDTKTWELLNANDWKNALKNTTTLFSPKRDVNATEKGKFQQFNLAQINHDKEMIAGTPKTQTTHQFNTKAEIKNVLNKPQRDYDEILVQTREEMLHLYEHDTKTSKNRDHRQP